MDSSRTGDRNTETLTAVVVGHPLIGQVLDGKYAVQTVLHQGRRNDLFVGRALFDPFARDVVLKVPHELSHESATVLAREAGFLSVIDHPNVIHSVDVGSSAEHAYLVLEPFIGETLADALQRDGTMAEHQVLEVFWQVLSATRALHEAGVVHRDLRPRNVCLQPRTDSSPLVKVIDFASARFVRADHPDAKLEPPYPVGAHRYMAPEQHRGKETGPWVDIYAIGMMVHAALVGELAEPGGRLRDRREVSPALDETIARALDEDPRARFESALDFQDALTRALLVP